MQLETTIAGIPCLILVGDVDYQKPFSGSAWQCDSDVDYYGGWDFTWTVCDRKGRAAPWLERKMTAADEQRIVGQIIHNLQENHEPH